MINEPAQEQLQHQLQLELDRVSYELERMTTLVATLRLVLEQNMAHHIDHFPDLERFGVNECALVRGWTLQALSDSEDLIVTYNRQQRRIGALELLGKYRAHSRQLLEGLLDQINEERKDQ